jgi:hypothetical protein
MEIPSRTDGGEMKTLYDILGVVPAIEARYLAKAYKAAVLAQLSPGDEPSERFENATSMWRGPRISRIAELTAAYKLLNHGDERTLYNRKLMKDLLICPVCEGRGRIVENGLTSIECAACKGTGKGVGSYD